MQRLNWLSYNENNETEMTQICVHDRNYLLVTDIGFTLLRYCKVVWFKEV